MSEKNKKPQETIELNDDALEQASGGANNGDREEYYCLECAKSTVHVYGCPHWRCTVCWNANANRFVV